MFLYHINIIIMEKSFLSQTVSAQIKAMNEQIISSIERVSKIAEKGATTLMLSLGSALIFFSMIFKIEIGGIKFTTDRLKRKTKVTVFLSCA